MALNSFLSSHHAGELVFDKRELFEIKETASVEQALKVMGEKNVRALPVVRTQGASKCYTGIISSFDLMSFIAFAAYFNNLVEAKDDKEREEAFEELKIGVTPIKDLVGQVSAEGRTVWTFDPAQSLLQVVEYFSKGVHRALVEQKDDKTGRRIFKLLSQSDVIALLCANADHPSLAPVLAKHLEELQLCNPLGRGPQEAPLITISTKDSALEGFRIMHLKDLQAVPVVDDQGVIVTTLSSADSKGINAHNITKTLRPVLEFLKEIHGGLLIHPITCTSKDTLGSVILKMNTATVHKHQVWVTDSAQKPIGVVSMSDVVGVLRRLA